MISINQVHREILRPPRFLGNLSRFNQIFILIFCFKADKHIPERGRWLYISVCSSDSPAHISYCCTWVMSAPAWCWCWRWWRSEPGMVVMEGDRQGQGGQAGWYEGGAGASSPLPSAQHHQVKPQCDLAMTTWYIHDLKISGSLHQREWELFQNDLQLHGKSVLHAVCLRWNTITRWVLNTKIKMTKPGWQAGKLAPLELKWVQAENCVNINPQSCPPLTRHFTSNLHCAGRPSVSVSRVVFILINRRNIPIV